MKKYTKLLLIGLVLVTLSFVTACGKDGIDYLVLVNKQNKLPNDWEEKVELVEVKNAYDEDIKVEKKAYEKYLELKEDLAKDGITIELDSAYRSVKRQQELWDEWSNDPEKGPEYVKKYVAVPGTSEHHTGLALDICLRINGKLVYENEDMIAETEIFSKIHAKIAKYGFILRYPEGKEDSTGYSYEPWHFRYIDSPEIAKEIMDSGLTFEEYLSK